VVRVTPFRYYSEVLFLTLKEEKSYDRIPNFTVNMETSQQQSSVKFPLVLIMPFMPPPAAAELR
jgi:hypothetical protein